MREKMIRKTLFGICLFILAFGFQDAPADQKKEKDTPEKIITAEREFPGAPPALNRYLEQERIREEQKENEEEGTLFKQGDEKKDRDEIKDREKEKWEKKKY